MLCTVQLHCKKSAKMVLGVCMQNHDSAPKNMNHDSILNRQHDSARIMQNHVAYLTLKTISSLN